MARILVVHEGEHGHARAIAERLGRIAIEQGHDAAVVDLRQERRVDPAQFDHVVVCASVHAGRHGRRVERWTRRHAATLSAQRAAFLSVSLGAAEAEGSAARNESSRIASAFILRTGFSPGRVELVAGELAYTKYGFLIRAITRRIAARAGRPTDTSRDHDFTDWEAIGRLGRELFPEARASEAPNVPPPIRVEPSHPPQP